MFDSNRAFHFLPFDFVHIRGIVLVGKVTRYLFEDLGCLSLPKPQGIDHFV